MRCDHCDDGERRPAWRDQMTERDGRTAVVLAVPVEECLDCGETWLTIEVAKHQDGSISAGDNHTGADTASLLR